MLLVSFLFGVGDELTSDQIKSLALTPYDGISIAFIDAYSNDEFDYKQIQNTFLSLSNETKKDIWPWVFLNRVVGYDESTSARPHKRKDPFKGIVGMSLDESSLQRARFLDLWKHSIQLAKLVNAPGVILDIEAYNNRLAYSINYLSEKMGFGFHEIRAKLKLLGADMAVIADGIYPEMIVLSLFAGLTTNKHQMAKFGEDRKSVSYVIEGFLDELKKLDSKVIMVAGGESSLGYCSLSYSDLENRINTRNQSYAPLIEKYPNLLLGGTIAPWLEARDKRGWLNRGRCNKSKYKKDEEFLEIYSLLTLNYKYVWTYSAVVSDYNPMDIEKQGKLHEIIKLAN